VEAEITVAVIRNYEGDVKSMRSEDERFSDERAAPKIKAWEDYTHSSCDTITLSQGGGNWKSGHFNLL
jgi:hypothetical protein